MSDLTAFLLARLEDDEAWAKAALQRRFAPIPQAMERPDTAERVLADVQAKRLLVELRETAQQHADRAGDDPTDVFGIVWRSQVIAFDAAIRTLAKVYADHPDYPQEDE